MVFAYYHRLGKAQQAVYRRSDSIEHVPLKRPADVRPAIAALEDALATEDQKQTRQACHTLVLGITRDLKLPAVETRVLSARPAHNWGELHGLYEPAADRNLARITVWMRTARHKRVVAFRTFLRTVLHELCHHLDYELFQLADSFHTEGFFKREASLFRQLVSDKPETHA